MGSCLTQLLRIVMMGIQLMGMAVVLVVWLKWGMFVAVGLQPRLRCEPQNVEMAGRCLGRLEMIIMLMRMMGVHPLVQLSQVILVLGEPLLWLMNEKRLVVMGFLW